MSASVQPALAVGAISENAAGSIANDIGQGEIRNTKKIKRPRADFEVSAVDIVKANDLVNPEVTNNYRRADRVVRKFGIPLEHGVSVVWQLVNGNKAGAKSFIEAGRYAKEQMDNVPVFLGDDDVKGWESEGLLREREKKAYAALRATEGGEYYTSAEELKAVADGTWGVPGIVR